MTKDLIPNFTALESKMEEHLEEFDPDKEELKELKEGKEEQVISNTIVKPKRKYNKNQIRRIYRTSENGKIICKYSIR